MPVMNNPAGFLIKDAVASGAGSALDTRHCADHGYLHHVTTVASARLAVQASHDGVNWMDVLIVTATNSPGTAQIAGFFPYVRGTVMNRYGDSTANMHYSPGLV